MTVRRAITILLDRGVVTTTQGKGTFVRTLDMGEAVFSLQEITELWTDDASVDVQLGRRGSAPRTTWRPASFALPPRTPSST